MQAFTVTPALRGGAPRRTEELEYAALMRRGRLAVLLADPDAPHDASYWPPTPR